MKSYKPVHVRVVDNTVMTKDTVLLTVEKPLGFNFNPGQFVMVGLWGKGECPLSICSSPWDSHLQLCIRRVGDLTKSLTEKQMGEKIGIRGPFGNGYPIAPYMILVGGGSGIASLRSLIRSAIYYYSIKNINIIYGAKTPDDLYFEEELFEWGNQPNANKCITVDNDGSGLYSVGLVTEYINQDNLVLQGIIGQYLAMVCGPEIMMKKSVEKLLDLGVKKEKIFVSMERYMKCGLRVCEHCRLEGYHVCVDGPVFRYNIIENYL